MRYFVGSQCIPPNMREQNQCPGDNHHKLTPYPSAGDRCPPLVGLDQRFRELRRRCGRVVTSGVLHPDRRRLCKHYQYVHADVLHLDNR